MRALWLCFALSDFSVFSVAQILQFPSSVLNLFCTSGGKVMDWKAAGVKLSPSSVSRSIIFSWYCSDGGE